MSAPLPPPPKPHTPWAALALVALLPAIDAVLRLGRIHPDEVYQTLEPALHRAFGFGVEAWEWQVGLRNWAVPGLFSWLLTLAHAVGIDDAQGRRAVLEVPQYLLHLAMLGAVYRFCVRRVEPRLALAGTALLGVYGPLVWFAGRSMGESISGALLVWGLERLDACPADAPVPQPFVGGLLLGFAEVARYGSAAVIVPVLIFLAATKRFRVLGGTVAGGLVVAIALGVLDHETWGRTLAHPRLGGWFHSFFEYVDFNLISGKAVKEFGALPPYFYFGRVLVAPWVPLGLWQWRQHPALRSGLFVTAALGYFVAISAAEHKEDRFIYPTLILLSVAATPGAMHFFQTARATGRRLHLALCALALAGSAAFYLVPSPFDVRRPELFQLTVRAGRTGHGLVVMNEGLWGAGGFFYLGHAMPWCTCDFPHDPCFQAAAGDRTIDRGIFMEDENTPSRAVEAINAFQAAGFALVEHRGEALYFERPAP